MFDNVVRITFRTITNQLNRLNAVTNTEQEIQQHSTQAHLHLALDLALHLLSRQLRRLTRQLKENRLEMAKAQETATPERTSDGSIIQFTVTAVLKPTTWTQSLLCAKGRSEG